LTRSSGVGHETWPHDPAGYVFLARAVDEIGKAMFGVHWTGKEWTTPLAPDMDPSLVARGAAVQQEIATLCETGKLVFGLRPISGGAIIDGPPDLWNTEPRYFQSRFYKCQMNAEDPSRDVAVSPRNSWIFIKRDTLIKQLAGHPFSSPPNPADVHLSPYLCTMLQVIREMRIDKENQSTKKKGSSRNRVGHFRRF